MISFKCVLWTACVIDVSLGDGISVLLNNQHRHRRHRSHQHRHHRHRPKPLVSKEPLNSQVSELSFCSNVFILVILSQSCGIVRKYLVRIHKRLGILLFVVTR